MQWHNAYTHSHKYLGSSFIIQFLADFDVIDVPSDADCLNFAARFEASRVIPNL